MDTNTVYAKTEDGEEAVRQRTRLVQRNLRNVLIMVDGHSSVAELGRRFGDAAIVERALAELADNGFIETVEAQGAGGIAAALSSEAEPEAPLAPAPPEAPPVLAQSTPAAPAPIAPAAPPAAEEMLIMAPEYHSLPPPARQEWARLPQAVAPGPGPGWAARLKEALAGFARKRARERKGVHRAQEEPAVGPVSIKTVRRGPRIHIGWPLLAVFGVLGLLVALLLAAVLFPYERYLPEIEKQASGALGSPVKVGAIGFSFLPQPNITLRAIEAGRDRDITVTTMRVIPDLFALLGQKAVIRQLELDGLSLSGQAFARLAQAGREAAGAGMEIRRVVLTDVRLEVGDAVMQGISGEVGMGADGTLGKILLRNADASLRFELEPADGGYGVTVFASGWKTPFSPALTIDFLEARGELNASRLNLGKLDARAYGGLIEGTAAIDWSNGSALAGELDLKRLDLARLLAVLDPDFGAEGELTGKLRLSAKAESFGKLGEALRAEAGFEVKRGAVKGFDLVEAVRAAGRNPTRGGITRFEQFSGSLQLDRQAYRLTNLRVSSGLMKASGQLDIGAEKRLRGVMVVELRGSGTVVRAPVAIAGMAKDPLLTPGRGAAPR